MLSNFGLDIEIKNDVSFCTSDCIGDMKTAISAVYKDKGSKR